MRHQFKQSRMACPNNALDARAFFSSSATRRRIPAPDAPRLAIRWAQFVAAMPREFALGHWCAFERRALAGPLGLTARSVTRWCGDFERAGLVEYRRGRGAEVRIVDGGQA